jgi:transcriptional regulator with XRE-family HTH domain
MNDQASLPEEELDSFSKRLKFLVEQSGVKQSHMAQKLGLSASGLHYILNNDVKFSKNAKKIAEYLNVNPKWLAEGEGGIYQGTEGISMIPVYYPDQIKLSLQQKDPALLKTQDYCPALNTYPHETLGLFVTDNSFSPKFELGDRLIIENTPVYKNGEIAALFLGQTQTIVLRNILIVSTEAGAEVFLSDLSQNPRKFKPEEGDIIIGCYRECHKLASTKGE